MFFNPINGKHLMKDRVELMSNKQGRLLTEANEVNELQNVYLVSVFTKSENGDSGLVESVDVEQLSSIVIKKRGLNILDYCYTTIKGSIPCPHFGKSDNSAVFLLPAYKQQLKWENPPQNKVQCWSKAVEDHLRDHLDSVDWTVFKCSVENLDEYATTVTDFISKCVEDCVPKKLIRMFPNHKPLMEIHFLLKASHAAFKLSDPDLYRKSRYDLRKAISEAKPPQVRGPDLPNRLPLSRQGLNDIRGYKMKQCKILDNDTSLPDMLTAFYARFELNTTGMATPVPTAPDTPAPSVTALEIRSVFLGVNPRKVTAEVPTCFKKTTIIPVPKKTHAV
eukprot:g42604.t1